MPEQAKQVCNAVDPARLGALMDKLVAVQLDLKVLCQVGGSAGRPDHVVASIAAACQVLQSAIEDMREVIHALEDLVVANTPTVPSRGPRDGGIGQS